MGLFVDVLNELLTPEEEPKKRKIEDSDLEIEMEAAGLTEDEKELVRNGDYDVWSFDEGPDLDEDDYYYDESEEYEDLEEE